MQVPLQITFRQMPHSEALESAIREKVAKLEEFYPKLTSCRVVVDEQARHKHQGRHFSISVDLRVPGHELAFTREHHEDPFVAVRDVFDDARRRLEDEIRVQRGVVKAHADELSGKVVRLVRGEGYGFIEDSQGRELYFSAANVAHPSFEALEIGAPVRFIEEHAAEGLQAKRVSARG